MVVQDQRIGSQTENSMRQKLNLEQKLAVNNLESFGYELKFMRQVEDEYVVFMQQGSQTVIVESDGSINSSPDTPVRS